MKHFKPFGLWTSPLSAENLGSQISLEDMAWDSDGETLVWLERRSSHSGLIAQRGNEARRELAETINVRGKVGYGGGSLACANGKAFFAGDTGQLFTRSLQTGKATAILPAFGAAASPIVSPDGGWVAYVFSDGQIDLLGLVDAEGSSWPVKLSVGADFYMQPSWHPSGKSLAWVEWDHPNMPWDGTRIKLAQLGEPGGKLADEKVVGGGSGTPAAQPIFSPDGRWLSFIESGDEWDQLILVDLESGQRRVVLDENGYHLMSPAWNQGMRSIAWNPDSRSMVGIRLANGISNLYQVGLDGRTEVLDTTPYTWLSQLSVAPQSGKIAMLASAPTIPNRLVIWERSGMKTVARSASETIPADYLPSPEAITWEVEPGIPAHGLFYPPANPEFLSSGRPPAILAIHGGPTAQVTCGYHSDAAYFTSRGYAFLEVNYRGSSGYGRTYMDALKGHWGEFDMEDAVSAGTALASQGLADGNRLVIRGGSAGGYTVLNSLVHYPGHFKAGICLYGVSNLFTLDLDTHKFEAHYTQSMVGALPEAAQRYQAWSPAFHAAKIRDPLYIFQGSKDPVVPPSQSEAVVASLVANGTPHLYKVYEGEGHGFRKSENIIDCLKETARFLIQHVLFRV